MNLTSKFLGLFRSRTIKKSPPPRKSIRPQIENLEKREVPTSGLNLQLQSNGDLLQIASNGKTSVIDQNVQSFGVVYGTTGQASLVDLHTNGQLMAMDATGIWSTLGSNIKTAQYFSDSVGHASVEVLGNDGSLKQYNVNTHQWVFIDWSNVTWMKGVADSTGKLQEIFWLNQSGSLYQAQANSSGSVIHTQVKSATIFNSNTGLTLITQNTNGSLDYYQESNKTWTSIWNQNQTWWQASTNSNGSINTIYWLDATNQLWSWKSGQKSIIATGVQSVTLNSQGVPQYSLNPISSYYIAIGKPSYLGTLISGLEVGPNGDGYQMLFTNGAIYWNSTNGNRILYGSMYQYWLAVGGASSYLGMPLSNLNNVSNSASYQVQTFQGGNLYYYNGSINKQPQQTPAPSPINSVLSLITDPGLRALTQSLYQSDGSIGRSEMIQILQEAESGGTVTSAEYVSLQEIVKASSVLKTPDSVTDLADKVVDGNSANSTYQGTTLGNLHAGSSSSQLEKLIDKWFYGSDEPTPTNDSGNSSYNYTIVNGTLFGTTGQPSYGDVKQGLVGDCYLLSALSSLALKNPQAIKNMITDNHDSLVAGDDTYTVKLWNNMANAWDYVTVDSKLPTNGSGQLVFNGLGNSASSSSNVLWASLIEKAVVQAAQEGWMNRPTENAYNNISSGWPSSALQLVTGISNSENAFTTALGVVNTFNAGSPVIFNTNVNPANGQLVADHSYVLTNYDVKTGVFTLFNPWGVNGGSAGNGFKPGQVTMTWGQIVQNMQSWDS